MTQLIVGTSHSLSVHPRPFFVASGLQLSPGERYRFVASGKWKDGFIKTDARGWKLWPLQHWNRVRDVAFFCLCGCVGEDDRNAFAIGAGRDWTVPDTVAGLPDKQLNLFANDWRSSYQNNHELPPEQGGPLMVKITRQA